VVDKLVAIEQRTITRQETWKAEWQAKITAISDLNTRLVSLKLDAQSKDIRSEMLSRSSSVSDEKVMTVVNTSTAPLGSYDVTVGTAIAEKRISRSFGAADDSYGTDGEILRIVVGEDDSKFIEIKVVAGSTTTPGEIDVGFTIDELARAINDAVADPTANPNGLNLSALVQDDKLDDNGDYTRRMVLTAHDGGSANRIYIDSEPAGLGLDDTHIDKPVYSTFLGSTAKVETDASSAYQGAVNKTVTFVASNYGSLGQDDVVLQWADTEGHSGKIEIKAADYDPDAYYDVIQGLRVKFGPNASSPATPGLFVQNESFTIDLQAPILQRGQDSGVAQTAKVVHNGFVDQISPIHTGSATDFTYVYQGVEHTVSVTSNMSLGILASAINEASDNPGVTASIVNDGQGTATSYHLVLTGNHTGAESTIEIKPGTLDVMDLTAGAFTVAREASNSMVKVDGFPADADAWIQRNTNELSDVIDGVVVTIKSVGTSTLNVANDPAAMRDKITQLVQSINFCKTYILENTKWGESNLEVSMNESGEVVTSRETANGLMIGNYGFQMAQTKLDAFMLNSLVPFSEDPSLTTKQRLEKRQKYYDDNGLVYTTMSDIGITSDPDNQGLYKIEEGKLLECIQKNPEAVIKLFTFSDSYTDIGKDGKPKQVVIRGAALALGEDMTLLTSDSDITDENGDVIQQGKGIMVTLQENYQSIIEGIDAKIAREERRIEAVRQRLTDRFNRLETALQQLQDKQSQLESSLASLDSGSSD
jgi:flagellar hook-associated protein 2